jgi:glucokinase
MILAGDVGGTNTRLAWCEVSGSKVELKLVRSFKSREHASLRDIVKGFVEESAHEVERACFGVAGPVRHGRARISNLTWEVRAERLGELLGLDEVLLANDLEACAYGIASLEPSDFAVLNEGSPDREGNEALISAGTGLGEAGLHWEGDCHRPFPSEGGHADFAPSNETEADLLAFLWKEHEHVSYERVVSGPGLYNIYRFLRDTGRGDEPGWLTEELRDNDPSPILSEHGLSGRSKLCSDALETFVSIYGAEAGNLALKLMATAGVFVGGGIAPKILPKLQDGRFFRSFAAKGRMSSLLERIPVRAILNDRCALLGAARLAALTPGSC